MRSIYRFVYIVDNIKVSQITKISVITQFVLSLAAFVLLVIGPRLSARKAEKERIKEGSYQEIETAS